MYGIGQGLNGGVRTAADFLFKGVQMKRGDKRFDDRLALDHAWNYGFYGRPSILDREASLPQGGPVPLPSNLLSGDTIGAVRPSRFWEGCSGRVLDLHQGKAWQGGSRTP